jgi:pimeloyl-ACP methyl ester carboxylesterase
MSEHDQFREERWVSHDGLALYARVYEGAGGATLPVICLPGLTRNSRDFEALAPHLARRYRVVCPDLRGRGFSAHDPTWQNYHPGTYLTDLAGLVAHLKLGRFAIVGTSLGGILGMLAPSVLPGRVAGLVLNDVGPEIDPAGADRIRNYAGRLPPVQNWPEAVAQLQSVYGKAWPDLAPETWLMLGRRSYRDDASGTPVLDADPKIGDAMRAIPASTPDLWPLFGALRSIPMLVIRGARSDILSARTLERMRHEHPGLAALTLENRGHVPLLDEPESLAAIDRFLAALDPA